MVSRRISPAIPVSTRLLNLVEAASWLNIGESTLRVILYQRRGPTAIKLPGSNRWRFRLSDLEAYVKGGVIAPVTEAGDGARERAAEAGRPNAPLAKSARRSTPHASLAR